MIADHSATLAIARKYMLGDAGERPQAHMLDNAGERLEAHMLGNAVELLQVHSTPPIIDDARHT
ncbi:hypothetical protein AAVH_18850 [Aphelenchoides avenae]|nr:hypothetical protein AAVH_18850 [Aphelenchus avenae]